MSAREVSSERELNTILSSGPTVVDFYATWCGPCKAFAPTFARLAAANPGINFAKVDVDRCQDIARRFSISAMPTFVFFVDSREVQRVQGADAGAIDRALSSLQRAPRTGGRTLGSGPARPIAGSAAAEEWYVGSGQAVLSRPEAGRTDAAAGPATAGGSHRDVVTGLFDQARAMGAQSVDPGTGSSGASSFTGSGRRLGFTPGPSPAMAPVVQETVSVRLSFYRNGLVVDDGPLRPLTDPSVVAIMQAIQRGVVPREIAALHPGKVVDVDLENRSNDDYVEKFKAFSGSGKRLASDPVPVAPAAAQSASPAEKPKPTDVVCEGDVCRRMTAEEKAAAAAVAAASSASTTTSNKAAEEGDVRVMLQLPNGSRAPVVLPGSGIVQALRQEALRVSGLPSCQLLIRRGVKNETLVDDYQTLAEAGCANSVIMVKP